MRQARRGASRRTQPKAFDRWLNLAVSIAVVVSILVGLAAVVAHLLFSV